MKFFNLRSRGGSKPAEPAPVPTPDGHVEQLSASVSTTQVATPEPYFHKRRKFKSARLRPGEYDERPWIQDKDPRKKWEKIIFYSCLGVGALGGAAICYLSYISVVNHVYCPILDEQFRNIDLKIWNYEIQTGGFGTGSFEWTTSDKKNIYTDSQGLHILPTLTLDTTNITSAQLFNGYELDLTKDGSCTATSHIKNSCTIRSNKTSGAIINPVRSARINTRGKRTVKYGKVEVVAKLPRGDWLWPAIWMMPESNVYGPWPASGEIDIAESKGNDGQTYPNGRNSVSSTLHWGPIAAVDAFWRTSGKHNLRRTDYSDAFHTYGLEWSQDYIFMYIDSRLLQVLFIRFDEFFWHRGHFGKTTVNNTALHDTWASTGRKSTPFDQDFYLILNLAVGATNGYFPDGVGNKPWGDKSPEAPRTFWENKAQWLPTWGKGDTSGLTVKSVKMWSQGACH